MKELLIKFGCTEEQAEQIIQGMKEAKLFVTSEENIEERYTKLKNQKELLDNQLTTATTTIENLKKNNVDNETLQSTIEQYKQELDTQKQNSDEKIKAILIDNALRLKLKDSGAKYEDLLVTKFDKSKLVIGENNTVVGIDEQLNVLKEGYKDLFSPSLGGKDPYKGGGPIPGVKNPWSKEHFNLTEQGRLLREDPKLAEQLRNQSK